MSKNIEKEYKFVLSMNKSLEQYLFTKATERGYTVYNIRQGYLTKGNRLREYITLYDRGEKEEHPHTERVRTFKLPLKDLSECLEWEDPVSDEDFNLAWGYTSDVITKTRFVIEHTDNMKWELDFFKKGDYTYLIMAECEVSNGTDRPTIYPDIITDNLAYVVEDGDVRFKNKQLSNVQNVEQVLQDLGIITIDQKQGNI